LSNPHSYNLYFDGLKDWTAGYFFNSGIVRIACAYEYAICTARGAEPFDKAKFEAVCNSLKQERPPAAIEQLLEVVKRFRISGGAEGRKHLNDTVDKLLDQFHFEEHATTEETYKEVDIVR
jgi:hypothetical protein